MTKAKTLDRIKITNRKFNRAHDDKRDIEVPILTPEDFAWGIQREVDRQVNGDICPKCGHHTLIHSEGCERCNYCGYDACAWNEV